MITPQNKENVNVTKSPLFFKAYDDFIQITKKDNNWNTYTKYLTLKLKKKSSKFNH